MATPSSDAVQTIPFATASGHPVVFLEPQKTPIVSYDLFTSLRLARRYHGHLDWTVLQHTVLCVFLAEDLGYSKEELARVAAHDMHEGYVGEVVTQLKQVVPQFRGVEDIWAMWVHNELGMTPTEGDLLKAVQRVDYRSLVPEMEFFNYALLEEAALRHGGPPTEREKGLARAVRDMHDEDLWQVVDRCITEAGYAIPGDTSWWGAVDSVVMTPPAKPGLPRGFLEEVGFAGAAPVEEESPEDIERRKIKTIAEDVLEPYCDLDKDVVQLDTLSRLLQDRLDWEFKQGVLQQQIQVQGVKFMSIAGLKGPIAKLGFPGPENGYIIVAPTPKGPPLKSTTVWMSESDFNDIANWRPA